MNLLLLCPKGSTPPAGRPGVLWIHGGGYITGLPEMVYMFMLFQQYMERFAVYFIGADLGTSALFGRISFFLRNHLNENWPEAELARHFSISESTLSRMFRLYTKGGYRGYMNTLRTTIARVYLESSDISIRELSTLLGYSDPNYFSTVFRKLCGASPEGFRKAHRNRKPGE